MIVNKQGVGNFFEELYDVVPEEDKLIYLGKVKKISILGQLIDDMDMKQFDKEIYSATEAVEKLEEVGLRNHFGKPYHKNSLYNWIDQLVKRYELDFEKEGKVYYFTPQDIRLFYYIGHIQRIQKGGSFKAVFRALPKLIPNLKLREGDHPDKRPLASELGTFNHVLTKKQVDMFKGLFHNFEKESMATITTHFDTYAKSVTESVNRETHMMGKTFKSEIEKLQTIHQATTEQMVSLDTRIRQIQHVKEIDLQPIVDELAKLKGVPEQLAQLETLINRLSAEHKKFAEEQAERNKPTIMDNIYDTYQLNKIDKPITFMDKIRLLFS